MRRFHSRLAAACALAAATAVFTGTALAGDGNGNGNGNGNRGGDSSGQPQQQSQEGTKPSSTTAHDTSTHAGDKPDVSKRYGNGKTAAEVAKSHGAPDQTEIRGPGNSQPHKVSCGSHWVDVHAVKNYAACTSTTSTHDEQPQQPAVHEDHKLTICHATGSATNPFVLITVDRHSLKHGHTAAKGDIIPAPAGGCPTATTTTTPVVAPSEHKVTLCHATGSSTNPYVMITVDYHSLGHGHTSASGDIIPPTTINGVTYSANWDAAGQAIFNNGCRPVAVARPVTPTTVTTMTPETPVTTTTVTTAPAASTPPTTTTTAAGVAGTTPTTTPQVTPVTTTESSSAAPVGGVLGAQTTLASPKPHRGVLGTVTHVAGGTLPFTGFPVWLAVLIALALILAGIALRRRTMGPARL